MPSNPALKPSYNNVDLFKPNLHASGRCDKMHQKWLLKYVPGNSKFPVWNPTCQDHEALYHDLNPELQNWPDYSDSFPSSFNTDVHQKMQPAFEFSSLHKNGWFHGDFLTRIDWASR